MEDELIELNEEVDVAHSECYKEFYNEKANKFVKRKEMYMRCLND